ncbi:MAG: DUF3021 family protein [Oscillospiraceae bacterium]|nr:DUF3021 family protein [Oscillospiraceae bacterium]
MKKLTSFLALFANITTGIVMVFIVVCLIFGYGSISMSMLISIPAASLITSLLTLLLFPNESGTRGKYFFGIFIHYAALWAVMTAYGIFCGWIDFDISGILTMAVSTAAVYIFTFAVSYLSSKRDADELNSALAARTADRQED